MHHNLECDMAKFISYVKSRPMIDATNGFTGRSSSSVLVQKCNSPDSCGKGKEKRNQIKKKRTRTPEKLQRVQALCPPVNTWDRWIVFVQVDNMQQIETRNKKEQMAWECGGGLKFHLQLANESAKTLGPKGPFNKNFSTTPSWPWLVQIRIKKGHTGPRQIQQKSFLCVPETKREEISAAEKDPH